MHTAVKGGRKHRKTNKKTKRGGYYGFSGALATGAPAWGKAEEVAPPAGGRRKRRGGKKTRKAKRGGGSWGDVSASFTGQGSRGLADYTGVPGGRSVPGVAAGGQFNNFGAQPGSGFGSFVTAGKA